MTWLCPNYGVSDVPIQNCTLYVTTPYQNVTVLINYGDSTQETKQIVNSYQNKFSGMSSFSSYPSSYNSYQLSSTNTYLLKSVTFNGIFWLRGFEFMAINAGIIQISVNKLNYVKNY